MLWRIMRLRLLSLFCCALGFGLVLQADISWNQFRGDTGEGHAESKELPLTWSESSPNVAWKIPVHGKAWSSPVLNENRIWFTTATEDGKKLSVICVDLKTGSIIHDKVLFEVSDPQFCHKFNSYASPTPVIRGDRVYVTFGSPGTACIQEQTGRVLWTRTDLACNHFRGAGSSPILYGDLLIMQFDGSDFQYVVALDVNNGRTVWKTDRSIDFMDLDANGKPEADGDWRKAYATPHVIREGDRSLLLSIGSKAIYGYNPETGQELWRYEDRSAHSAADRPVYDQGIVYYTTGFARGTLAALKLDKDLKLNEDPLLWKTQRSVSNKPSVQKAGDLIFMIHDGGVATCLDAKSGEVYWHERIGGNYSASPIHAAGRIYFCNEEGKTTVIRASKEFEILSENELESGFMASPAVAGNSLILRTKQHLYKIDPE